MYQLHDPAQVPGIASNQEKALVVDLSFLNQPREGLDQPRDVFMGSEIANIQKE